MDRKPDNFIQECMYVYGVRSASHVTVTWQHANHSCIYIHMYIHMYVRTKGLGKESEAVVSYVKVCQMLKVTNSFRQLHQPVLWEVKHPEVLQVGDALHTTDRQEQEPCTHVHIRTYVCTYIHKEDSVIMNLSTYVRMYMDRYLYTVHTILCMYMHTYVHTYMHTVYTYIDNVYRPTLRQQTYVVCLYWNAFLTVGTCAIW